MPKETQVNEDVTVVDFEKKSKEHSQLAKTILDLKNMSDGQLVLLEALNAGTFPIAHLENVKNAIGFLSNQKRGIDAQIKKLQEQFYGPNQQEPTQEQ